MAIAVSAVAHRNLLGSSGGVDHGPFLLPISVAGAEFAMEVSAVGKANEQIGARVTRVKEKVLLKGISGGPWNVILWMVYSGGAGGPPGPGNLGASLIV